MSAIKKLIISLIVIIGILAVALISVYIVARVNLGVDLFRTVGQLKTLSQPVNEQESFPAAYRSEDLADLKSQTDSQLGDVVLYEEGKGYEGYTVDFTALALSGATAARFPLRTAGGCSCRNRISSADGRSADDSG